MVRHRQASLLSGRRVLVIEDEYFLADDMAQTLRTLGAEVIGPVGDVQDALGLCSDATAIDLAVLDINLKGQMIYPVAQELRARAIPFIFTSGYDPEAVPDEFRDVPMLRKPLDDRSVARAMSRLARRST